MSFANVPVLFTFGNRVLCQSSLPSPNCALEGGRTAAYQIHSATESQRWSGPMRHGTVGLGLEGVWSGRRKLVQLVLQWSIQGKYNGNDGVQGNILSLLNLKISSVDTWYQFGDSLPSFLLWCGSDFYIVSLIKFIGVTLVNRCILFF